MYKEGKLPYSEVYMPMPPSHALPSYFLGDPKTYQHLHNDPSAKIFGWFNLKEFGDGSGVSPWWANLIKKY